VCVLEKENRVGGRMTTDRMNGFIIDRGVTVLGDEFGNMKKIVKRFSLQKYVSPIRFSFGLVEGDKRISFRAKRIDDLLFYPGLQWSTRMAIAKLGMDVMLKSNKLFHGLSSKHGEMDDESVAQYMDRLNGDELKNKILSPGMTCAFGGHFEENSKLILLQTVRNILLANSWTIDVGVDLIPETMAKQVPVKLNCTVASIEYQTNGVSVKTTSGETYFSKAAVIALPGDKVRLFVFNFRRGSCKFLAKPVMVK
jgi:monoamine oxidase